MAFLPILKCRLVLSAKMFILPYFQSAVAADRAITGSGFLTLNLPVAKKIRLPTASAELLLSPNAANDCVLSIAEIDVLTGHLRHTPRKDGLH
jgi:hypothetical protein